MFIYYVQFGAEYIKLDDLVSVHSHFTIYLTVIKC